MISVIIPAYNYAHYLPYAVHSALMQQQLGLEVEVIVVDDGSTDDTPAVLQGFGTKIRTVRQENKGLSAARNTGMSMARGEALVFLDADDMLPPGTLATQWKVLEERAADIAICLNEEAWGVSPTGPFIHKNLWNLHRDHIPVHLCKHNVAPVHAYMVRASLARSVGDFNTALRACEDHDFWLRCAAAGARFAAHDQALVFYRKHASSMSAQACNQLRHDVILHQRVQMLLGIQPLFVRDMQAEAWLAHAAGCLRTLTSLLSLPTDQRDAEQGAWVGMLLEYVQAATRQAALLHTQARLIGSPMQGADSVLAFYALMICRHMRAFSPPLLPVLAEARQTALRLLPHKLHHESALDQEFHGIWSLHYFAQQPAPWDTLLTTLLCAVNPKHGVNERPKVLLCSDFFWPSTGGCELFMEELGRRLVAQGYAVHVVTRNLDERASLEHQGMQIIPFHCQGRFKDGYWGPEYASYAMLMRHAPYAARILLVQPDSWMCAPLLDGPLSGNTLCIPVINPELLEDWQREEQMGLVAQVLRSADHCLCLTESGLDKRVLDALGVDSVFLPHAVGEHAPAPGFRQRYGLDDKPLLVHVANFWPVKNHLALLQALQGQAVEWQLALIGNSLPWPGERQYFEDALALANKDARVRYLGGLAPDEADAAIAEADILLLPSKAECRPLVILQAMRHGTPWIATPQCNSVHDDAGGLIVPVERFGQAVRACLAQAGALHALGALGRRHWEECFQWSAILPCFLELIRSGVCGKALTMPEGIRTANVHMQHKLLSGMGKE